MWKEKNKKGKANTEKMQGIKNKKQKTKLYVF